MGIIKFCLKNPSITKNAIVDALIVWSKTTIMNTITSIIISIITIGIIKCIALF